MLPLEFYLRPDVVQIARDLLGMVVVTETDGVRTAGRITETEAYQAPEDRASHAYGNRRTERTSVMFEGGGRAYVFLVYGVHHLFNVVTGSPGLPHAVLVRAVEPLEGLDVMLQRRGAARATPNLTTGPGALCQALGITTAWTNQSLVEPGTPVWIEDRGLQVPPENIEAGPRIGIDYALEWAPVPWRFWERGTAYVKKGK
jgi:DNA-3-methyladenine glycosylase